MPVGSRFSKRAAVNPKGSIIARLVGDTSLLTRRSIHAQERNILQCGAAPFTCIEAGAQHLQVVALKGRLNGRTRGRTRTMAAVSCENSGC